MEPVGDWGETPTTRSTMAVATSKARHTTGKGQQDNSQVTVLTLIDAHADTSLLI